jgi:menaquinone-dependent protoporphyrinogen oxidase
MRVLVTWGSKRGGTEGIARILAEALEHEGFDVAMVPAEEASKTGFKLERFDAVVVGGALYANRWHAAARRFVNRKELQLRRVPVWFFSSGPLDDSADVELIPPTRQVKILMERVGAQDHVTFGGRLSPDAGGFAAAMAKTHAGDWRNPERIRRWAAAMARALPNAQPGVVVVHPARSLSRLVLHGFVGWASIAAAAGFIVALSGPEAAVLVHALVVPAVFVVIARHYFSARGARDALPAALGFLLIVALFDLLIAGGFVQYGLTQAARSLGWWLSSMLVFLATWATGGIMSTLPWPRPETPSKHQRLPPDGAHAGVARS